MWRKIRTRARNSVHEKWLIYWVQILLIAIVSVWLFVQQSGDTDSRLGAILKTVPVVPAVLPPQLPFRWKPTFGLSSSSEQGIRLK